MKIYEELSERTQKYVRAIFVLFVTGIALASFMIAYEYAVRAKQEWRQAKSFYPARQISVSGKGEKSVKPDTGERTLLKSVAASSIQPGEQEIKSTVTITYELR